MCVQIGLEGVHYTFSHLTYIIIDDLILFNFIAIILFFIINNF